MACDGDSEWTGSANDLERQMLTIGMPSQQQSRKLLSWPGACGTFLGRLASKKGCLIVKRIKRGRNFWHIDLDGMRAESEDLAL
jgi:hypothetical protein